MTKRIQLSVAMASVMFLCSIILAQDPVVNIDKGRHPNLAEAQRLVVEANRYIHEAQKDNRYDMKGHASAAALGGSQRGTEGCGRGSQCCYAALAFQKRNRTPPSGLFGLSPKRAATRRSAGAVVRLPAPCLPCHKRFSAAAYVHIPDEGDQRSDVMSITIPG
jgi:hypothetical protein